MTRTTTTIFLVFALSLAGCAQLKNAYDTATSAKVPAKTVYIAVNAFDAAKITAKNYIIYCTAQSFAKGLR